MQPNCFKHMLIALALLSAQWAGLAHSIEHRAHLEAAYSLGAGYKHVHQPASDLLHSCLLFDGLTTAHTAVSNPYTSLPKPVLASLRTQETGTIAPRNTLFAQRVRVRDPPVFS